MTSITFLTAMTVAIAATGAEAKTRLLVNCFWPSSHFACSTVLPNWVEEVERVTEGRVTGIIPPKSVAPPPEQLAAIERDLGFAIAMRMVVRLP